MKTIITTFLLFVSTPIIWSQDCVRLYFEESIDNGVTVIDLKVDNFTDILGTQLSVAYFNTHLSLIDVIGNQDINISEFSFNTAVPGYINLSWSNPSVPQTLMDGDVLLQMRFNQLLDEPSTLILDDLYNTEFIDENVELKCFTGENVIINDDRAKIKGSVYHDTNDDCFFDAGDNALAGWVVKLSNGANDLYAITNNSGNYLTAVDLGIYTVEVLPKNSFWTPCVVSKTIEASEEGKVYDLSFMITGEEGNPALHVSMAASAVRRCVDNDYYVYYRNEGTSVAENAQIVMEFDERLSYSNTDFGLLDFDGQLITANLGDLAIGAKGSFRISMNLDCDDADLGQTVCVRADIVSDETQNPPIDWDGAVISSEKVCDGDSVEFILTNIGDLSPVAPLNFIVVEDDVMFNENQTELAPQEDYRLRVGDNGSTYRIISDQEEGYPYGKYTTEFIASCNVEGESFQFISMFPNEDEAPIIDIECKEVVDAFIPNTRLAYPVGYRADHHIEANQDIEYTLVFQNMGTDTVSHVFIEELISPSLDIESVVLGPSSHNYNVSIIDGNKLRFDFYNILLPRISDSENLSTGYVSYKISQKENLPQGTIISNTAEIYYDQDGPITASGFSHLIGEDFIEIILNNKTIVLDDEIMAGPNPTTDIMKIEVPDGLSNISYVLYNQNGQIVNAANCPHNVFYINKGMMLPGMYLLEIRSEEQTIGKKKVLFQE